MLLYRILESLWHVTMSSVFKDKIVHKSYEIKSEANLSEDTKYQAHRKKSFLVNNQQDGTSNAVYAKAISHCSPV